MARLWLSLLISALSTAGCGPDHRECTGPHPDFVVQLELRARNLPADTVVHVAYGGSGMEDYSVQELGAPHEVVFCNPASRDGGAADLDAASDGAAGAPSNADTELEALRCELWTGGFATLEVRATGIASMTYPLTPREHVCTSTQTIVLDSPDGG